MSYRVLLKVGKMVPLAAAQTLESTSGGARRQNMVRNFVTKFAHRALFLVSLWLYVSVLYAARTK